MINEFNIQDAKGKDTPAPLLELSELGSGRGKKG